MYPYLFYGNIQWANINATRLEEIYRLQKKALRITTFSSYISPSSPLFRKLDLLNIFQINELITSLFLFEFKTGSLPAYFNQFYDMNTNVHCYNTRSSNNLHNNYNRTNYGKFSVRSKGIDIWNRLSTEIRTLNSKQQLKNKVKNIYPTIVQKLAFYFINSYLFIFS